MRDLVGGPSSGIPQRLPLTAIVASRNEAPLLEGCLRGLAFCDEVIVIDIASTDNTATVAEAHGARVIRSPYVPIAEWARIEVLPEARHPWLLFTDPDEEIPAALGREIAAFLASAPVDVALVWAPIQFYFRNRPLRGTIWGGENRRRLLVRREGVELTRTVFGGTHLRDGYRTAELRFHPETAIRHKWATGYRDWIAKHRRYLALEPVDRADTGHITGLRAVAGRPWHSFYDSYVRKRGYRDGLTGLALSALWALYATASEASLFMRLRRRRP